MRFSRISHTFYPAILAVLVSLSAKAVELGGQINLEHRQYIERGIQGQDKGQSSLVINPELYWETSSGDVSFTFAPFYRYDSLDDQRSHGDLREALLLSYWDDYEIRVGVSKLFWGVTESTHLVDVVNQTDGVESVDGEQKLGQPMLHLTAIKEWGTVDALLLPYFRERTFAGEDGRLRSPLVVSEHARYQSSREDQHIDYALRYSVMLDDWDLGLSYFHGTNRDPYFNVTPTGDGLELTPFYAQSKQLGIDLQGIVGDWLWKFEGIYRDTLENYTSFVGGFEYTSVGVFESVWDIGWIAEYLYDSRGENAQSIGQNDLFIGSRLVLNDEASSEVLFGVTQDLDHSDVYNAKIEASSRLSNHFKWRVNAWLFENQTPSDLLYFARKDDFIELSLEYYF
ncbi:hypothetical protein [Vibrio fluminensis]|uniref:hypothetical protein n=1 Tax=Vibrio fluminensis TaxID=2783614 RepID=UPI00188753BB|nr:hypothetical protein [Vibrio fluminensis]